MIPLLLLLGVTAIAIVSPGLPLATKRPLRLLGSYVLLAYVLQAAYLKHYHPVPHYGDSIANPLLFADGYTTLLNRILMWEAFSLAVIILTYFLVVRLWPLQISSKLHMRRSSWAAWMVAYALGYSVRLYILYKQGVHYDTASSTSALFGKLSLVSSLIVGYVFFKYDNLWSRANRRYTGIVVLGELIWSLVYGTKAPIILIIVAWYLGLGSRRLLRRQVFLGFLATILIFAAVGSLRLGVQSGLSTPIKGPSQIAGALSSEFGHLGPAFVYGADQLVARADGMVSAASAFSHAPGFYLSPRAATQDTLSLLFPSSITGGSKVEPGIFWGQRMLGVEGDVSIAEGYTAEGWSIGGAGGVTFESLIVGLLLGLLARCALTSNGYLALAACGTLASLAFVERGLLGDVEVTVNAFEVAAFVWFGFALWSPRLPDTGVADTGRISTTPVSTASSRVTVPER